MTDAERAKAFQRAQKEILKARTALLRDTRDEVMLHLADALEAIQTLLARAPADYQHWDVKTLQKEIDLVLAAYGERAAAVLSAASTQAWEIGVSTVDKPLTAAGIGIIANLPAIDTRQLMAMRTFMVDRIKDAGTAGARQIGSELGLVMIGAQGPSEAIGRVRDILGDPVRTRATTIVRTELGRAYAVAAQERLMQAGEQVPGLKKQWRRSGKIHSRLSHDAADGQIKDKNEPFVIFGKNGPVKLMHPHDPKAPAGETINCGCVALPFMDSWAVTTPGRKAYTEEEIRLNPMKRDMAQGKTVAQALAEMPAAKSAKLTAMGTDAYEVAKAGGKHAGWYEEQLDLSGRELNKGARRFERKIAAHESWLADPTTKMPNFYDERPERQRALLSGWQQDIERHRECIEIIQGVLRSKKNG